MSKEERFGESSSSKDRMKGLAARRSDAQAKSVMERALLMWNLSIRLGSLF